MQKLFPTVSGGGGEDDEPASPLARPEEELDAEWRHVVQPKLLTLVHGHPDPDVREAADFLSTRIFSGLFYLDGIRARRQDGEEATVAIHRIHDGLTALRKAVYHAPFRINRPEPRYTGLPIGTSEPLVSKVVRARRDADASG